MIRLRGITPIIMLALVLGFAIPLGGGLFIMQKVDRRLMEEDLHSYHQEVLAALADSSRDALISFSPGLAKSVAAALMHDQRIIAINIYSTPFGMHLATLNRHVESSESKPVMLRQIIVQDGEELGYVEVTIDLNSIGPLIKSKRDDLSLGFLSMLAVSLLLVIPTVYIIVLRPLRKLTVQARRLGRGKLDIPLNWEGENEIALLGKTMEGMRRSLRESFHKIHQLATVDDLTGIPNRRAFISEMEQQLKLCHRHGKHLSVVILDIDHFKKINDTWGHATGDLVLIEFAGLISKQIRSSDLFARFGGEEFVLCMPETPLKNAHTVVDKLRVGIEQHVFTDGLTLTASFGMAGFSEGESLETLLSNADLALYDAKQAGRNRVSSWPV